MAETVDRLVFVPDHGNGAAAADRVDEFLIGPVEVLIFIDKHVVEMRNFRMGRVLSCEIQRKRNDFADEHGVVKDEPTTESLRKS